VDVSTIHYIAVGVPVVRDYGLTGQLDGVGSSPAVVTIDAQTNDTVLAIFGGRTTEVGAPTDGTNTYTQRGSTVDFTAWPDFGWKLWGDAVVAAAGSLSLSFAKPVHPAEEITVAAFSIQGGGTIGTPSIAETTSGATATTGTVTTSGPAVLMAWHSGDTGVTGSRDADPNAAAIADGWAKVLSYELTDAAHVQVAVAIRTVMGAGTYSITWDHTPTERAIVGIVAVEAA
jgi:hypothetical protein